MNRQKKLVVHLVDARVSRDHRMKFKRGIINEADLRRPSASGWRASRPTGPTRGGAGRGPHCHHDLRPAVIHNYEPYGAYESHMVIEVSDGVMASRPEVRWGALAEGGGTAGLAHPWLADYGGKPNNFLECIPTCELILRSVLPWSRCVRWCLLLQRAPANRDRGSPVRHAHRCGPAGPERQDAARRCEPARRRGQRDACGPPAAPGPPPCDPGACCSRRCLTHVARSQPPWPAYQYARTPTWRQPTAHPTLG